MVIRSENKQEFSEARESESQLTVVRSPTLFRGQDTRVQNASCSIVSPPSRSSFSFCFLSYVKKEKRKKKKKKKKKKVASPLECLRSCFDRFASKRRRVHERLSSTLLSEAGTPPRSAGYERLRSRSVMHTGACVLQPSIRNRPSLQAFTVERPFRNLVLVTNTKRSLTILYRTTKVGKSRENWDMENSLPLS
ncbi:hypothetical protein K0M31_009267 [Melipona bicolor]|uniref:Uncharacterized protein n=1 Tax=Melipona bicolor TaxID=60889 RepID=A0AA40FPX0_9HYME|nr:hypothetical protein K0M31_009267 [Melipona bicolor]